MYNVLKRGGKLEIFDAGKIVKSCAAAAFRKRRRKKLPMK